MNTRRKMFSGLVLAAAALLALSGCKKDEGEKVVLSAEFEQPAGGQKTYINDHSVCWTSDDAVRVNDAAEAVAVSDGAVEVTENNNGYAVAYPFEGSTLSGSGSACTGGTVVIPADQAYATTDGGQQKMRSPMAARLDAASGRLYFKNLHSLIRVDVTTVGEAFDLESITITSATANLAGTLGFGFKTVGTTADAGSAPTLDNSTLDKKSVTLNFSEPLTLAANTVDKAFYLCVAPFTNTNLEIKVTGTPQGGTYAGKKGSYVFSRENKHLDRSIMAEVKANFGDAAFEPFVPGFSVGAGTTVEFAPGNLYWDGSAFHFEENQWSFADTWNANHVSHFFWSNTTDWQTSGKEPYAAEYSNSEQSLEEFFTEADGFQVSGETGTWRTLSKDEWVYLLGVSGEGRSSGHSTWWIYNKVTIEKADGTNNVTGLIIYPDEVTAQPAGLSESVKTTLTQNNKTAVDITKADFEKLEDMGCVFLPAAGYRNGTSVYCAGSIGFYWSSTYDYSSIAYNLRFDSGSVDPSSNRNRIIGQSVRLVKNVK